MCMAPPTPTSPARGEYRRPGLEPQNLYLTDYEDARESVDMSFDNTDDDRGHEMRRSGTMLQSSGTGDPLTDFIGITCEDFCSGRGFFVVFRRFFFFATACILFLMRLFALGWAQGDGVRRHGYQTMQ